MATFESSLKSKLIYENPIYRPHEIKTYGYI